MTETTVPDLVAEIQKRALGKPRLLVAIAGPPGAGKSTLAADLAARIGPRAAVLPMDGFHLDNETLVARQLLHRKGAPQTFDAAGLVALLQKLRDGGAATYPTFDREADRTRPDDGQMSAAVKVVLAEGNYLLLNTPPWADLADIFDLTVRMQVDRAILEARLLARWLDHGMTQSDAQKRVQENDMRNADFVAHHSRAADFDLMWPPKGPRDV